MENQSSPPIDADDRPADAEPQAVSPIPSEIPEGKPYLPAKTSPVGRWILIVLGAVIVGFAVAFIWLYVPASKDLRQATSDLAAAQEKLTTTTTDLETTTAKLNSTSSELTAAQLQQALAKVEANVAYARLSLVTRDLLTARQEVSAASENMTLLLPLIPDTETATALKDRMANISDLIITDSAKALEELRTLSENLLRLETR